jgi:hypothetical protein
MRRRSPTALGVLALVALTACSSGTVPASGAPPAAPQAQRQNGGCGTGQQPPVAGGHHLVSVDTDITAAQLTWVPGLNSTQCQVQTTTADGPAAKDLAADIDAAPSKTGTVVCPNDDASAVIVALHTPDDRWQSVYLKLTGCAAVLATGKKGRPLSDAIRADLKPLAPPDWHHYLG